MNCSNFRNLCRTPGWGKAPQIRHHLERCADCRRWRRRIERINTIAEFGEFSFGDNWPARATSNRKIYCLLHLQESCRLLIDLQSGDPQEWSGFFYTKAWLQEKALQNIQLCLQRLKKLGIKMLGFNSLKVREP